ncbi:1-O-acylceramide synthase precursor, putative [Entamoeba invadens IP1]|uniref:1-O-acylceramide synthase, putative n=1 Tax=Entamoeba invadens IP1 TaxID=370355 RepID=A0A0A1U0R3_ENTIV|nr:1-O-acylceramide synthase precursor, putative [Entamoeba invadens IP1]ELP87489.1 1-O-acylceramide synthase precursor, putative [Entamoeba invadens IP1]|eukprot:XP_004254260.1 1-O-acylceramide synthase precursor, putative [Entamoeba invadens IP1]
MLVSFLLLAVVYSETCTRSPIVLIPGILSSILEGEVHIPSDAVVNLDDGCKREVKQKRLWVAIKDINPFVNDCYLGYLRPTYVASSNIQTEMTGVTVTVPKYGSTYALDSVDPNWPISLMTKAFHDLIKKFEKLGYKDGADMLGAPYDWRYFRFDEYSHKENWYENTKNLIKKAYDTYNSKVVIISHSMGGLMSYKLLDYVGKDFATKYIKRWAAMSTPWIGSVKATAAAFPGHNMDLPISATLFRSICRTMETCSLLFPNGGNTAFGSTPILTVKDTGKQYTVDNTKELLNTIGGDFAKQHTYIFENGIPSLYKKYNNNFPHGVETHCLYSAGYDTIETVIMATSDYDGKSSFSYADGDGTVNIQSLRYCEQLHAFNATNVGKADHTGMLDDKVSYKYLQPLICG